MKRKSVVFLMVCVLLAGCNLAKPTAAPGETAGGEVAIPYQPTVGPEQPAMQPIVQAVNGVQVAVTGVQRDGKQVNIDVCFTLPDASDWSVSAASLRVGDEFVTEFGMELKAVQEAADGKVGVRCDMLYFYVPPDADLSTTQFVIDSIAAFPREGEYCTKYLAKIQQAMLDRNTGITVQCVDNNMVIAAKPDAMSQQEAEQIVYSEEFYTITGPWTFELSVLE
jgi:hypothetical protein